MGNQIVCTLGKPSVVKSGSTRLHLADHCAENSIVRSCRQFAGQRQRKSRNLRSSTSQPVVGHPSGKRKSILPAVEAVLVLGRSMRSPASAERLHSVGGLLQSKEISVER